MRLLIVGDSFWQQETDGLEKFPNLTEKVVDWALECQGRDKNLTFYRNVEYGIMARNLDERIEREAFWQRIAFITFSQRIMGRSDEQPTWQDTLDARPVVLEVLDVLRPNAVLVTRSRGWNALGEVSGVTSTLCVADPPLEIRQWSRQGNAPISATWIYHPCYRQPKADERFTRTATHDRIARFLDFVGGRVASMSCGAPDDVQLH